MRPGLILAALAVLVAPGLSATTRTPVPLPPTGFYLAETYSGPGTGELTAFCFARGHGNSWFGEGAPMAGDGNACGPVEVWAVGDSWQSRQRCNLHGQIWDYSTTAVREGQAQWRLRTSIRPLAARNGLPSAWEVRVRKVPGPCPRIWRPGDYLTLRPHADGSPWQVYEVGTGGRTPRHTYYVLPPALAALIP